MTAVFLIYSGGRIRISFFQVTKINVFLDIFFSIHYHDQKAILVFYDEGMGMDTRITLKRKGKF